MRVCIICFLLVITGEMRKVAAQLVPVTIFYDQNCLVTIKQNAAVMRVASLDTVDFLFKGTVTDYYTNGQSFQQFAYSDAGKEGPLQALNPNKELVREGAFKENLPVGIWQFYYPDGKPQQTIEFLPNQEYRVLEYYTSQGQQLVKDGTGSWETTSRVKVESTYMDLLLKGQWKDGKRTGQWQFFLPSNGKMVLEREYENGVVKKRKLYDQKTRRLAAAKVTQEAEVWPFLMSLQEMEKMSFDEAVFGSKERTLQYILKKGHLLPIDSLMQAGTFKLEKQPEFPGGQAALFQFMGSNFRIPASDARHKVHGTVLVSFIVGVDGAVSDAKVVKSLSQGIDAEALRVVNRMPKWKPATRNGIPVPYTCTVPYNIRTM